MAKHSAVQKCSHAQLTVVPKLNQGGSNGGVVIPAVCGLFCFFFAHQKRKDRTYVSIVKTKPGW
jgi:hypothetical protein